MSASGQKEMARASFWQRLRQFTPARIGLGHSSAHLATRDQLAFQLAHAAARDAVHTPFDGAGTCAALEARGFEAVLLHSSAQDRITYLTRPDLGRCLDAASRWELDKRTAGCDVAFVIADGLSALAVHHHAVSLIEVLVPLLNGWRIGPIAVVEGGRVAVGDEIGEALGADSVLVMIGERPGLSSPDSLGAYVTWAPRVGRTDAERNCVSNIHVNGLSYAEAAAKLAFLLTEARRRKLSGVMLKDDTSGNPRLG